MSNSELGTLGANLIAKVTKAGVELPDDLQQMVLQSHEDQERESQENEEEIERIETQAGTVMNLEDEAAQHGRRVKQVKRRVKSLEPSELDLPEDLKERLSKIEQSLETAEGAVKGELLNDKRAILHSEKYRFFLYKKRQDLDTEVEKLQNLIKICAVAIDQMMANPKVANEVRLRKAMAALGGMPEQRAKINSRMQVIHRELEKVNSDLVEAKDPAEINEMLAEKDQLEARKRSLDEENQTLLTQERVNNMIVDGCPTCMLCSRTRTPQQMAETPVTRLWNSEGNIVTTRLTRDIVDRQEFRREDLTAHVCKYHLEQTFTNALTHKGVDVLCSACGGTPGSGKCSYGSGTEFPAIMFRRPNGGVEIDFQKPFDPTQEVLVCPKENAKLKRDEGLKCSNTGCARSFDYLYAIDVDPDHRGMYPRINKDEDGTKERKGLCRNCLKKHKQETNRRRRGRGRR